MGITVWPVDAVGGAPEYSGRDLRQALSPALAGATAIRPLGALSGVRPGTPADTVEVSGSTWTCHPHAGVIDGQSAAEAGPYWYAVDADVTGPVDAANATNPRQDLIYARISDPAESDGSTDPEVEILYLAGTAASSPTPPATPARSIPLAVLNVPKAGGGATTVTWVAPYMAAPGGFVYARSTAERNALAATLTPSTVNPLIVFRANATAGRELEYTTDGSTWQVVDAFDTGYVTHTVSGASAAFNQYRRIGDVVYLEGEFWSITEGTIFTLPEGVRPRRRLVQKIFRAGGGGLAISVTGDLYIQTDGTVQIRGISGAVEASPGLSLTGVTFITADPFPA